MKAVKMSVEEQRKKEEEAKLSEEERKRLEVAQLAAELAEKKKKGLIHTVSTEKGPESSAKPQPKTEIETPLQPAAEQAEEKETAQSVPSSAFSFFRKETTGDSEFLTEYLYYGLQTILTMILIVAGYFSMSVAMQSFGGFGSSATSLQIFMGVVIVFITFAFTGSAEFLLFLCFDRTLHLDKIYWIVPLAVSFFMELIFLFIV